MDTLPNGEPGHGKLIRHNLANPDMFQWPGQENVRPVKSQDEHLSLLRRKMAEEMSELCEARTTEQIIEEAADLFEVLDCYIRIAIGNSGVSRAASRQIAKRQRRGSFIAGMVWDI